MPITKRVLRESFSERFSANAKTQPKLIINFLLYGNIRRRNVKSSQNLFLKQSRKMNCICRSFQKEKTFANLYANCTSEFPRSQPATCSYNHLKLNSLRLSAYLQVVVSDELAVNLPAKTLSANAVIFFVELSHPD